MVRVKPGKSTRASHKKTLKLAKGYWMSRRKQIKKATEAVLHAGQYAYDGRKIRKRDYRRLWITRINAALQTHGIKYSAFIHKMKEKNVELDRKILAQLALDYPKVFQELIQKINN
ncbi:50S ribosomal protein L20 [Candidatus Roizmanbacteria bacterium RIFCSPLOWO2_01_FULL_38_12]|uniref:Large ribosomal subunit protein bL20 n=1 Tax=Candidatus Roizmanbacteria bacterium RIFCSPLOWO2_01_FULL_38_12 TaxID=1802061 RepID=A0A1F7IV09_9BACT|nr:MAG: 50S ribosomal protein L20 [Candidatus Roizmanbacteria bacterium RIFCSPHIGHO2_01_FULL_38_15]OGK35043.1 MAG: 50S ribosomal protein L20 [Candidatus Roizmanbacteria bacterium RIFCSPHIGHO2_12_FULL_38_13]OGK47198.1 MAG: 50S ribosomal protein L20 [Candidatus Roizmanbacteria bacterium RIFCSPLOWO2_01_FULL_38_12]